MVYHYHFLSSKDYIGLYVLIMSHMRFRVESTLCGCLNVKELLAQSRQEIWTLSNCNWTQNHNHLVHKQTLNHLAKYPTKMVPCDFRRVVEISDKIDVGPLETLNKCNVFWELPVAINQISVEWYLLEFWHVSDCQNPAVVGSFTSFRGLLHVEELKISLDWNFIPGRNFFRLHEHFNPRWKQENFNTGWNQKHHLQDVYTSWYIIENHC